jgi:hypothetical protein
MKPYRLISLSRGACAKVDLEDFDALNRPRWTAVKMTNGFYAQTSKQRNGVRTFPRMHRVIIGALPGQIVDHINGDTLDNRRANLRFCSKTENGQNRLLDSQACAATVLSGNRRKPFWARFGNKSLGTFATREEAESATREAKKVHNAKHTEWRNGACPKVD